MREVGAFEAKTHLARLLDEVAGGEEVVITRHGRAVARIVPMQPARSTDAEDAQRQLRAFRRGKFLGGGLKETIDEGRSL